MSREHKIDPLAQFSAAVNGYYETAPKITVTRTGDYSFHATVLGVEGGEDDMEDIQTELGLGWLVTLITVGSTPTNIPIIGIDADFTRPWRAR